jgi:hypothetical protein
MTVSRTTLAAFSATLLLAALASPGEAAHDLRPPFYFAVDIVQATPGGIPTVTTSSPGQCFVATWPSNALVSCSPPPGFQCMLPVVVVTATGTNGTVQGSTGCGNSTALASVTVRAPGQGSAVHLGHGYDFPFYCRADFTTTTGTVHCHEPDP